MAPIEEFHDFFVAAGGVAGALIGLLFVAISVAPERLAETQTTQIHRVRASAALTAFSNALVVSLLALDPGIDLSTTTTIVGIAGLLFVAASLISLVRTGNLHRRVLREAGFLGSLLIVFGLQLQTGLTMGNHAGEGGVNEVAVLVVVSFLIGISRAWELIGAPNIGIGSELVAAVRGKRPPEAAEEHDEPGSEARP
jgi:hypothetical protein